MVFVEERLVIGFDDCRLIDSEIHMHEEGFYTGEQLGNAGDDSVYVYVYKMGPDTVE